VSKRSLKLVIYLGNDDIYCILTHAAQCFIFPKMPFISQFYLIQFK